MVTRPQPIDNLRFSLLAISKDHRPSSKLIGGHLEINEGLIFAVAQNRRIGHYDRILNFPSLHESGYVHVFFQLLARIQSLDTRLQGAGIRIERSRNVGNAALEESRVRVG